MKSREVLANLLASCNSGKSVAQLHSQILKAGLSQASFFATKLNALYAKYDSLGHARKVFDETPHRTVYLWNATLRSYCRENRWEETLCLFRKMMSESRDKDEKPDSFTIPIALKACARNRFDSDLSLGNALLNLYAKTGSVKIAARLFTKMPEKDVVSWSSMIACYTHNGDVIEVLNLFNEIIDMRIEPNSVTLVSALQSMCTGR
ncbi:hypothetical protein PS2_023141 [Malus domestica]